jgi:hypothetical protein
MNSKLGRWMLALLCIFGPAGAAQTDREFIDEHDGYRIVLIGDWRASAYNDAIGRRKTEFVFRDRSQGLLRIGKQPIDGRTIADIARTELEGLKLCEPGLSISENDVFVGASLPGRRLAFCYTERGRWVAAAYYFFEDGDSVWILRFTGRMGMLDVNMDLTDRMARSFSPKYSFVPDDSEVLCE